MADFPTRGDDPTAGLLDLTATADGCALAEAFPRITDPAVRHAVTWVVEALASA